MRNYLFILSITSLLVACEKEESGYEISGTVDNSSKSQNLYVSELDESTNQPVVIDTIEVTDGKFEADLPEVQHPTISFLRLDGARGMVVYVADNTPITFELYTDSLYTSKIEGGSDNKILNDYTSIMKASQKEMGAVREKMMTAYSNQDTVNLRKFQTEQEEIIGNMTKQKKEVVQNNPNSIISLMVMQELVGSRLLPTPELQELFNSLSPELRENSLGQNLKTKISQMSLVDIGSKAPDFQAPTPEGDLLALNEVLGKVTLIDFWASWCKPCRRENPNIVKVYEKYHDKGFNAIGVSLDREGQKDKWLQAISDDNLLWPQVSYLQFWNDPIARQYGIQAIPAAFLLDENGVIVAKNLRGPALEQKVAELLGEE